MDPIFRNTDVVPHLIGALEKLEDGVTLLDSLQDVLARGEEASCDADTLLAIAKGHVEDVGDRLRAVNRAIATAKEQLEEVGRETAPAFAKLGAKLSAPVGAP